MSTESPAQFWETYYATGRSRWSGNPNASLVAEVTDLSPGTALDLGCGQGGDAIWLASRGWTVTAVDISAAALEIAERNAVAAGVTVTWSRHDLAASFPGGSFDLVAATYLHSPVDLPRTEILRAAAAAVAPGGTLLIIGHAPSEAHPHPDLRTGDEILADLALDWPVVTNDVRDFDHAFAGEDPHARTDAVVRLRRRPAGP